MNKLYIKLMSTNIKNGKQFYVPFILSGAITVMLFYNMMAIFYNDGLSHMSGGNDVKMIFGFGNNVIIIFSFIFIFYTNSFIMKRRKRDIGIYNILGMEKKHIAGELFVETVVIAVLAIAGGLSAGIVFNKFFMMLLYKILAFDSSIKFMISGHAVYKTVVIFAIIYSVTMIYNIMQVRLSKPVELLSGSNTGEKEPKTKIIMTILGLICIAVGYFIAITTENPISALSLFFVAVVLVILGTYFLFMAGSIAFLKLLRNNKNYYYKKNHFVAVSGMLYRMKQNSVGLSNICILSTMVLVMVSTTVSMFIGEDDILKTRFESEINISAYSTEITDSSMLDETVENAIKDSKREITDKNSKLKLSLQGILEGDVFSTGDEIKGVNPNAIINYMDIYSVDIITRDYAKKSLNMDIPGISEGEIVICGEPDYEYEKFTLCGKEYIVKDKMPFPDDYDSMMVNMLKGWYYIIVDSMTEFKSIYEEQNRLAGGNGAQICYDLSIDIDGTREQKKACGQVVDNAVKNYSKQEGSGYKRIIGFYRENERQDFYGIYGGLFFLGVFLGSMFLMITVLIIFYKQISEGYEDKHRFEIMEKVGMSKQEIKVSIRSQIRTVFLLPIIAASIHVAVAFPMIRRMLLMLNMTNTNLYIKCTVASILIFIAIYVIVFILTSRTYYKVVGSK